VIRTVGSAMNVFPSHFNVFTLREAAMLLFRSTIMNDCAEHSVDLIQVEKQYLLPVVEQHRKAFSLVMNWPIYKSTFCWHKTIAEHGPA
jgi:hypothetical protein